MTDTGILKTMGKENKNAHGYIPEDKDEIMFVFLYFCHLSKPTFEPVRYMGNIKGQIGLPRGIIYCFTTLSLFYF